MSLFRRGKNTQRARFEREALPYMDVLYANAMRLTRSPADAEDLVQETFLKAFRFYDRFEQGSNMKAWLLRIQYNAFVNRYRKANREAEVKDSLGHEPDGQQPLVGKAALTALTDPEGAALRPLLAKEIEAALDALPEEHRTVVVLADVEELSYKEIAEVMGCPIGTVMSRLHRARRSLRKQLLDNAAAQGSAQVVPLSAYRSGDGAG